MTIEHRRRVLHVIDSGGPGGAETVLATIVAGLDGEVWESRVVVGFEGWLSERLRSEGWEVGVVPTGKAADFEYLRGLAREMRSFAPDVVHTHLLGSAVYGNLAALCVDGLPTICTLHGRPDVPDPDRFRAVKARVLTRSSNTIAYVSEDLRRWAEPFLGVPHRLGRVVHNGVRFDDPRPSGRERAECGVGPGEVLIGAVGNVRPAKDYATLLRAAALVRARRPDVRFAIAGDDRTPLTARLKGLSTDLGVSDGIVFLGFRSDVAELLSSFDVFVSSSLTEGLPLATVEAVAAGKPVVLTRVGGVPEVVESGVTGRLVPAGNPEALARGILDTLADRPGAAEMARKGAADVRERFSAEAMCRAYADLYTDAIESASS